MNSELKNINSKQINGSLNPEEINEAMELIMTGKASDIEIASFLTALQMRGINSDHLKTAIKLAKQNCHLFIEKPLSTEKGLSSINKLIRIAKNKKLVIRVGYQLRYHPGVEIIKNIIKTRDFGNILNGYFHFGVP